MNLQTMTYTRTKMCTSLIVINNFFKWTRKYKQNNSPHVDDLTDNVRCRRVWWTIRKEVVEEQFEVANDDKLTHPTLSDATWLWYLRLTRNRCNDYIINVTIFLIAENGTIGGAKRRIQRTRVGVGLGMGHPFLIAEVQGRHPKEIFKILYASWWVSVYLLDHW